MQEEEEDKGGDRHERCILGFQLFFWAQIRVPTVSCSAHHFSKKKKETAGTCVQPCPTRVLYPCHVGHRHDNPNVVSLLSKY